MMAVPAAFRVSQKSFCRKGKKGRKEGRARVKWWQQRKGEGGEGRKERNGKGRSFLPFVPSLIHFFLFSFVPFFARSFRSFPFPVHSIHSFHAVHSFHAFLPSFLRSFFPFVPSNHTSHACPLATRWTASDSSVEPANFILNRFILVVVMVMVIAMVVIHTFYFCFTSNYS